jgi:hypothetical protein
MLVVTLLFILLPAAVLVSGCATAGKDPVIGTWEWSDGKGYSERYTFGEDYGFSAEALGSTFSGTWEPAGEERYLITYTSQTPALNNESLHEMVLYDRQTDAIYFPAHQRVPSL